MITKTLKVLRRMVASAMKSTAHVYPRCCAYVGKPVEPRLTN